MNLIEDKLRLVQEFIGHLGVFYRFTKDPIIAHSLHAIYEFLIMNSLRSPVRTPLIKSILFLSISIDQNRVIYNLNPEEMDHLWPFFTIESHINLCVLYLD